jgi:hypothetical protein
MEFLEMDAIKLMLSPLLLVNYASISSNPPYSIICSEFALMRSEGAGRRMGLILLPL